MERASERISEIKRVLVLSKRSKHPKNKSMKLKEFMEIEKNQKELMEK